MDGLGLRRGEALRSSAGPAAAAIEPVSMSESFAVCAALLLVVYLFALVFGGWLV